MTEERKSPHLQTCPLCGGTGLTGNPMNAPEAKALKAEAIKNLADRSFLLILADFLEEHDVDGELFRRPGCWVCHHGQIWWFANYGKLLEFFGEYDLTGIKCRCKRNRVEFCVAGEWLCSKCAFDPAKLA